MLPGQVLDLSDPSHHPEPSPLALREGDLALLGGLATLRLLCVPMFNLNHRAPNVTVALMAGFVLRGLAVQCSSMHCPGLLPSGWDGGVDAAVALELHAGQQERMVQILMHVWKGFDPVRLADLLGVQAESSM